MAGGRRGRVGGAVVLLVAAGFLGVGSAGVWLSQIKILPPVRGQISGESSIYVVHGLQRAAGRWVLVAAVLAAVAAVAVAVTRRGMVALITVVPAAVAGAALGYWLATLQGGGLPSGVGLSLVGLLALIPAVALGSAGGGSRFRWMATATVAAVALVALIALASTSSPGPDHYRVFQGPPAVAPAA